jgi:hypothetical protein
MAKNRGFQRSYVKAEDSLDSVGAIPAATRSNALSRYWSSGAICCAAHDPESENSTCEPEDGGKESKGNVSFPPLTDTLLRNITPIKDAAAIQGTDKL